MISYIDSHAHITAASLEGEEEAILLRAKERGIKGILNICTDRKSLERGLQLSKQFPWLYHAGATTPHDVEKTGEKDFSFFQEAAKNKRIVAIGETGLDYHYLHSPKDIQQKHLIQYLTLATKFNLPIIFHCRDAFSDLFSICDTHYRGKAVLHCFTGTVKEAEEVLTRGWYLSLSGIVTFKKCGELKEVAKKVPLHQLLVETDTPYLAPGKYRGKINEPAFLPLIVEVIAEIKGIDVSEVAFVTSKNVKDLVKMDFSL